MVVDQFEELITLTPKDDRLPFLSLLLAATEAGSEFTVLLTLRADYYSAIYLDPRLSDGVQRGLVNVGAMMRDELRSAIEGPARWVGLEFEPGLVDRLLDDVGDEPGNLPLLEFALTELWERREGRRLTNAAYERLGGVAGAIGRRAEAVFARLPMEQQAAAPRLFGRLVRSRTSTRRGETPASASASATSTRRPARPSSHSWRAVCSSPPTPRAPRPPRRTRTTAPSPPRSTTRPQSRSPMRP